MTPEEMEAAVGLAREWADGRSGSHDHYVALHVAPRLARALLASRKELKFLRLEYEAFQRGNALANDDCTKLAESYVSLEAELARIRPVMEAACAWLDTQIPRWSVSRCEVREWERALWDAIDTARREPKREGG